MSFFAKNSGRRWFYILSAILLLVALLQSTIYLTCYDSDIGLYKHGFSAGALKIAYLLIALFTLSGVIVLPLCLIKKTAPSCIPRQLSVAPSRAAEFFALLTAASVVGTLITQLVRINADDALSILLQNPSATNTTARTMLVVSLVLALFAAIYFVAVFAGKKTVYPLLLTLIWVCAYMLRVYFDTSVLLMSPTRQMTLIALAAIALFLIAELRLARDIPSLMLYTVSATLTALFAGVSGFSSLLLTAVGSLPLSTETVYFAFQLMIALFALFRLNGVLTPVFAAFDKTQAHNSDAQKRESVETDNETEAL